MIMAGKICSDTTDTTNTRDSRAYCEGRVARAASALPVNPYTTGTPEALAWSRGVASKVAGDPNGCCANSGPAAV